MALSHQKLQSFLSPYLLEALEPRERELLRRHLAKGCMSCELALAKLRPALGLLSSLTPESKAPGRIREALLRNLRAASPELSRQRGQVSFQDSILRTAEDAEAELRVPGEAIVAAKPGSLLRLWRGAQGLMLRIEKGGAMIQVKSGCPFIAEMPLGRIAVRGTYFFIESLGARDSYFCLCEGWIGLDAPGLKSEFKSEDHQAFRLHRSGSRTLRQAASPEHYEPELSDLD